jgi:thymidine phosphorylase
MGIDTGPEAVVYLRRDSHVYRSEGFESATRVWVSRGAREVLATVNVVLEQALELDQAGLSESAWTRLGAVENEELSFAHPMPLESLSFVRAKIWGRRLDGPAVSAIIRDIAAGYYSDVHLASFLSACGGDRLTTGEVADLTAAMVATGERLEWPYPQVLDKHSIGGLPGNRTTLIVVPIVSALGLVMPKTSSRAITSPAGTADTMETLAPVALDQATLRRVVEREGGCIAWGGAARLSPVDEVLIRVERALDLDSPGQLVASILSKKLAAGATHVLVDLPVGDTAKMRTLPEAHRLAEHLREVGKTVGLRVSPLVTDGSQPVGRGIGPALEARDVLGVLRGEPQGPEDLRDRAILLAGHLLEFAGRSAKGAGGALARSVIDDGRAWRKFEAICHAQGGLRRPPVARYTHPVTAPLRGRILRIDNRRLARVAKLAGAPQDPAAGLELHVRLGDPVDRLQRLFTVHANAAGTLAYAMAYAGSGSAIVTIGEAT